METAMLHRHVSTKSYTLDLLWVCCFSAALSELPQWTVSVYLNRLCNTCTDQATLIYSFYWLFAWRAFSHTCSSLVSVVVFSSAPLSASLSGAVKHDRPKMAATLTLNWNESAHNFLKKLHKYQHTAFWCHFWHAVLYSGRGFLCTSMWEWSSGELKTAALCVAVHDEGSEAL